MAESGGCEVVDEPAEAEADGGVVSSGMAREGGERKASLLGAIDCDDRNISLCVTQSIVGFFWCNHEYPRTA